MDSFKQSGEASGASPSSWTLAPIEGESLAQMAYNEAKRRKRLEDIKQRNREAEAKRRQPIRVNPFLAILIIALASYIALRFKDLDISCKMIESGVSCIIIDRPFEGETS